MKTFRFLFIALLCLPFLGQSQMRCAGAEYQHEQLQVNPELSSRMSQLEQWVQAGLQAGNWQREHEGTIVIPVVFHNLYHTASEKVTDAQIQAQLKTLNECFRMRNADTVNTRPVFKSLASDCEIEFRLAISDSRRRSTTGIIRKYTPITSWKMGDDMKFTDRMGDNAWDANSYLNIWICKLDKFAGFTSVLGGDLKLDGIVLDIGAIGAGQKTLVHEVGHWLGLKHLWGDEYCGDDGVGDTPKQASYTPGCPTTIRITCGNNPTGDMYNNYMDFTNDGCMTLFTDGQKRRMRTLFATGGLRAGLLNSVGLKLPLIAEMPMAESDPTWLQPKLFPNPATNFIQLDLSYDRRWVGQTYQVVDLQGQIRIRGNFQTTIQRIELNSLRAGYYVLEARRTDGVIYKTSFVKL